MTLHAPAMWVFILSLVLVVLAVVGVFVEVPYLIDVCILGCCFGLCSAGARQCSNSIEERVNRDATGIEPNIFDLGIVNVIT